MNLKSILQGWNFLRWLRLIMGVAITFQAFESKDMFIGIIALLLFYQAFANVGCYGANNCKIPLTKNCNPQFHESKIEEHI